MESKYQVGQWVRLLGDKSDKSRGKAHILQRWSITCEKETQYNYEIRFWEHIPTPEGRKRFGCTIKTFWVAEIEIEGVIENS